MLLTATNTAINIIAIGMLVGFGIIAIVAIKYSWNNEDLRDPHDCFNDDDNQFI